MLEYSKQYIVDRYAGITYDMWLGINDGADHKELTEYINKDGVQQRAMVSIFNMHNYF